MREFEPDYLYHIASLYYRDMLSQQEIANREQLSRPQVSRMLTQAKNTGIVRIELVMPNTAAADALTAAVKDCLGLNDVHIVSYPNGGMLRSADETQRIGDFALRAAPIILRLIDRFPHVGLGWGRTLYQIADRLPDAIPAKEHIFIPLAGSNSGVGGREYQIAAVTYLFSEKLHSRSFYLNISNSSEGGVERTASEAACLEQLEYYWSVMDAAVFSVGLAYAASGFQYANGGLTPAGDILLQCYYTDGSSKRSAEAADMIAIDIQRLKKVPHSILAAIGSQKVEAIVCAAQLGFCNTLVTDAETAQGILNYCNVKL